MYKLGWDDMLGKLPPQMCVCFLGFYQGILSDNISAAKRADKR